MNTFEVSVIAFVVGVIAGAVLEWKYGPKVQSDVAKDVAALKTDVADLKAKAAAVIAKV